MTPITKTDLVAALRPATLALRRIASALEALIPEPEPETTPETTQEPEPCQHPKESRLDFGTTNGLPDWQCRACGYRTPTDQA